MKNYNNYKTTIFSWSIYDFANQPFTTIIVTFIYSNFFASFIASNKIDGGIMWGHAITISSILIALLSPIMGSIADNGGYRKQFLIFWTWICIIFSYLLYFPVQGQVYYALLFFCIANIGFEMGGVFLNAYLPDIAPKEKIGRISGYGWSFGYVGGLIALGVCYLLFVQPENPINPLTGNLLDINSGENYRIINIFIAIWLGIFSLPTFLFVKDSIKTKSFRFNLIFDSFKSLRTTFQNIKEYNQILRFLLARLIYNDGLITIFAFGGIYAKAAVGFSDNDIFLFAIVLNITAGLGAFLFGFIDDQIGGKNTIQITNIGFIIACLLAFYAGNINNIIIGKKIFWIAGILIGIFAGPNQAASRSFMSRLIPSNKENEFFGFFAFSGKATAFIGPLLFSTILSITGKYEIGILFISIFFLFGFLMLRTVKNPDV